MASNTNFGGSGNPGTHIGATPPDDPEMTWIYTGSASNSYGVSGKAIVPECQYYNTGTNVNTGWKPVKAVWG